VRRVSFRPKFAVTPRTPADTLRGPVLLMFIQVFVRWACIIVALLSVTCANDSTNTIAPSPTPPRGSGSPEALTIAYVAVPGQAVITVTVLDEQGMPVSGVRIAFTSSHGTVIPRAATSDAVGVVHTTLTAIGAVTVTARVTSPAVVPTLNATAYVSL
jgi:Bacterial Ig-like domain (group 1)